MHPDAIQVSGLLLIQGSESTAINKERDQNAIQEQIGPAVQSQFGNNRLFSTIMEAYVTKWLTDQPYFNLQLVFKRGP